MKNLPYDRFARDLPPLLLRVGLGCVLFRFGLAKILHPADWILFIPGFIAENLNTGSILSPAIFLRITGVWEIAMATQLFLGGLTRLASGITALMLAVLVVSFGASPTGMRDFALLCAALSLTLMGPGRWSLDWFIEQLDVRLKLAPQAKPEALERLDVRLKLAPQAEQEALERLDGDATMQRRRP